MSKYGVCTSDHGYSEWVSNIHNNHVTLGYMEYVALNACELCTQDIKL